MTRDVLTIEQFHARPAAEVVGKTVTVIGKLAPAPAGQAASDNRTVPFVFSTEGVDFYNDTVAVQGWEWDKANGVVALFGHNSDSIENVIGRGVNIRIGADNFGRQALVGDIRFAKADESPTADAVYKLTRSGYLNQCSVGFLPIDWSPTKDRSRPGGVDFKRQRLLEISVVPVGANPQAVALAKAAGIDVDRLGLTAAADDGLAERLRESEELRAGDGGLAARRRQAEEIRAEAEARAKAARDERLLEERITARVLAEMKRLTVSPSVWS